MTEDEAKETCMCGDAMQGHANPMNCGHTAVSIYDYYEGQPKEQKMNMNYSTAIFLFDKEVRAVKGIYEPDPEGQPGKSPRYTFKTYDKSIKPGDFCAVPTDTRHGSTTFQITDVDCEIDIESGVQLKWIICKLDLSAYNLILEKEKKAIEQMKTGMALKKREELADALKKAANFDPSAFNIGGLLSLDKPKE